MRQEYCGPKWTLNPKCKKIIILTSKSPCHRDFMVWKSWKSEQSKISHLGTFKSKGGHQHCAKTIKEGLWLLLTIMQSVVTAIFWYLDSEGRYSHKYFILLYSIIIIFSVVYFTHAPSPASKLSPSLSRPINTSEGQGGGGGVKEERQILLGQVGCRALKTLIIILWWMNEYLISCSPQISQPEPRDGLTFNRDGGFFMPFGITSSGVSLQVKN